jgi:hypothetical protein
VGAARDEATGGGTVLAQRGRALRAAAAPPASLTSEEDPGGGAPIDPPFVDLRSLRSLRGELCLRRATVALGALLLLVALGGCQISQDAVRKDPFLQELVTAQQAQAQSAQAARLGAPFTLDNTRWTVRDATSAYALQFGRTLMRARGAFVVVTFAFENLSGTAQPPQGDMLEIQGPSGKATVTYAPDRPATARYAAWTHQADFLTATLRPGAPYTLTLVFDVPRGARGLSLRFHSYPDPNAPEPMF